MRWVLSLWESSDLALAIDPTMRVIVMTDRGLRSPNLRKKIRKLRWRPYMRRRIDTVFRLDGGMRMPARKPVSAPGNSFIGRGTAFRAESKRLEGTIIVTWVESQDEPWIILTDLEPEEAGASWHGMRFWIETGFKALKRVGWQWQKTRRTDPARVERYWFALSAATVSP